MLLQTFWLLLAVLALRCRGSQDAALTQLPASSITPVWTTTTVPHEGDVIVTGNGDRASRYKLLELIEQLGTTRHSRFGPLLLLPSSSSGLPAQLPALAQPHALNEIVLLHTVRLGSLNHSCVRGGGTFCVDDHIAHGGHGDVWRGNAIAPDGTLDSLSLVLKRMGVQGRPDIELCAQREIYFGRMLRHNPHFTSLLSHFVVNATSTSNTSTTESFWLVFRDEGVSLSRLIYALTATDGISAIYEPSLLWRRLRTTSRGEETLKALVYQLISVVANLHSLSIAHRDIKPGNVLLNSDFGETRLVLGDWSSAVDAHSLELLYGQGEGTGPSTKEQTMSYAPPEAALRGGYRGPGNSTADQLTRYKQYDIWSVGVVFLELILGTDDVFRVDQRTAAVIEHRLAEMRTHSSSSSSSSGSASDTAGEQPAADHEALLHDSLMLAGLADYCIYTGPMAAGRSDHNNHNSHNSHQHQQQQESCRGEGRARSFANAIRKRDPLGLGFEAGGSAEVGSQGRQRRREAAAPAPAGGSPGSSGPSPSSSGGWGTDLLLRLLQFDPSERLSMKEALGHAWFAGPWVGRDGRAWATRGERDASDLQGQAGGGAVVVGVEGAGAMPLEADTGGLPRGAQGRGVHATPPLLSLLPLLDPEDVSEIEESDDDEDDDGEVEEEESDKEEEEEEQKEEREDAEEGDEGDEQEDEQEGMISPAPPRHRDAPLADHAQSPSTPGAFSCPRCGRRFHEWGSCHSHMQHRRHLGPALLPASASNATAHHITCLYDAARARVPDCMAAHSLLPRDRLSGWCDVTGRRALMEDAHCLMHSPRWGYALYGVFDGHLGSRASKFASRFTGQIFDLSLGQGGEGEATETAGQGADESKEEREEREDVAAMGLAGALSRLTRLNPLLSPDQLPPLADPSTLVAGFGFRPAAGGSTEAEGPTEGSGGSEGLSVAKSAAAVSVAVVEAKAEAGAGAGAVSAAQAASAMQRAFVATSHYVNEYEYGAGRGRENAQGGSGTTATVAVVFAPPNSPHTNASSQARHLLIASAGDSRAVLCCTPLGLPVVLSEDHTPKVGPERNRVLRRGGRVVNTGHTLRVNGQLAVTRSIGDSHLRGVLTARPDVLVLTLVPSPLLPQTHPAPPCMELRARLASGRDSHSAPLFLILGSDGLFDVVSNAEAVDLVCAHLLSRMGDLAGSGGSSGGSAGSAGSEGSVRWLEPSDELLHGAARMLAQEAYVRGSGDNIGVCVIALDLGFSKPRAASLPKPHARHVRH